MIEKFIIICHKVKNYSIKNRFKKKEENSTSRMINFVEFPKFAPL